jgi:hypothetical protein
VRALHILFTLFRIGLLTSTTCCCTVATLSHTLWDKIHEATPYSIWSMHCGTDRIRTLCPSYFTHRTVHIGENVMTAVTSKRVQVYWNLHRQCYSVRQSGRVIGHTDQILLNDVRFNVAPAGRDKVRATGVKNVHATVSGYVDDDMFDYLMIDCNDHDYVAYNPFKYDQFVKITARAYDGFDATPVYTANHALLLPNREIRAWWVK